MEEEVTTMLSELPTETTTTVIPVSETSYDVSSAVQSIERNLSNITGCLFVLIAIIIAIIINKALKSWIGAL